MEFKINEMLNSMEEMNFFQNMDTYVADEEKNAIAFEALYIDDSETFKKLRSLLTRRQFKSAHIAQP